MAAPKGHARYGGRKKGTPNKLSLSVKESVLATFKNLGGVDHMTKWAKHNPTEFYKIAAKLIPQDVNAAIDGKLTVNILRFGDNATP